MYDYDYGLKLFNITLRCNGTIIIIRTPSKNIRAAKTEILKSFRDATVINITFIRYIIRY